MASINNILHIMVWLAITVLPLATVTCTSNNEFTDAGVIDESRYLFTGDNWSQGFSMNGFDYTVKYEIIGEDIVNEQDCYVVKAVYEPPMVTGIKEATLVMYLDNRFVLSVRTPPALEGSRNEIDTSFQYEFDDCQYYPLEVGKECSVKEQKKILISGSGDNNTEGPVKMYRSETNEFTYKVDTIEEVTVPAGTFECFKVDMYDDSGNILSTSWKSEQIKFLEVRSFDYRSNEPIELLSFSLSKENRW